MGLSGGQGAQYTHVANVSVESTWFPKVSKFGGKNDMFRGRRPG